MGTMSFRLPPGLSAEVVRELGLSCLAGSYDNVPVPTHVSIQNEQMVLRRDLDESGYVTVPWAIDGAGRLVTATATLIERPEPYDLLVELARGKVNQVRNQAADWRLIGLVVPPELEEELQAASRAFGRAVAAAPAPETVNLAREALRLGSRAAGHLAEQYIEQVIQVRHSKSARPEATFGVRVNGTLGEALRPTLAKAVNAITLPMTWRQVEPASSQYNWDPTDAVLTWAQASEMRVAGGPLIDFSEAGLPAWLSSWSGDLANLASVMCDYVETAVGRYRGRIRRWQLTAGANKSRRLGLGEDELLWLTARLAEAALQVDPDAELILGLAQPWGEYMVRDDSTYSPVVFADTLLRAGLRLAAVDLEWVMGVTPRGSYCRDLIEASRQLDNYFAQMQVPLTVTIGYPASSAADSLADPRLKTGAGCWQTGYNPEIQAAWLDFASMALSKPYVRGVTWCHLSDAAPHLFPNCGLLDNRGQPRPALERLRELHELHYLTVGNG
jgi:hypothetical protein